MRYNEYPPPIALSEWVECFWVFEGEHVAGEAPETIVADGFPELIVHFGCPYAEADRSGKLRNQSTTIVSGQLTMPLVLHSPGQTGIIAIRFKPAGMAAFTRVSMRHLTNERVEASELFQNVDSLVEGVRKATNDAERIRCCVNFLMRSTGEPNGSQLVHHAVRIIQMTRGSIGIGELARQVDTGKRSLELSFLQHVGVSPKQFCRIVRFRHAFDLLTDGDANAASLIAVDAGFFDQSHLIRDFRQFAGAAPKSFIRQQSVLSQAITSGC